MTIPYQTLDIPNDPTPWVIVEPSEQKEWAVLWLQGWGSTIEGHFETIQFLAKESDVAFAMIDYAGWGTHPVSLGTTTRKQQYTQVVAAYDALKERGYKKIIACGNSFGSYMSALLCDKRELAAVLLRAPAIYDDSEFTSKQQDRDDDTYQSFKNTVQPDSPLAALRAIRGYSGPVFVFEHGADEVIPSNIPKSYFANARQSNYLYIPGAPHSPKALPDPRKYYEYIETAILDTLEMIQLQYTLELK